MGPPPFPREDIQKPIAIEIERISESQRFVTGEVRLRCEMPGRCLAVGRRSPVGLYDYELATYETADRFRHDHSEGFVRLWGLGVETWAARQAQRDGAP